MNDLPTAAVDSDGFTVLAASQPDTTLASIYELLGVRNESDAGAGIARLHIAARQPEAE